MRNMPEEMWDIWESGQYVGDIRPVTRATIQKAVLKKMGPWRSLLFDQSEQNYEIPNIQNVTIDRRLGSDAGQMTMTILNQVPIEVDANLDEPEEGLTVTPRETMDLAKPGYYTFRRGVTPHSAEFGHTVDPLWVDMFIPNRLIRTFQGWGTDGAPRPWDDTKLVLTGTWLIDRVEYKTDGYITITCRDVAKLLIEQRLYPPIIPVGQYPLEICADYVETKTETYTEETTVEHEAVKGENVARILQCKDGYISSNTPWYGCNNPVYGHKESHAFDDNLSTYWLSMGNNGPNELWSFEWIGGRTFGEPVNKVRIKPKWGGYKYYIAVMEEGKWQGDSIVPYGYWTSPAYPNQSNKPYVKSGWVPKNEDWFEIELPRIYNADQVRIIFTNLQNSGLGSNPYRAAVYEFQVLADIPARTEVVKEEKERDVEFIVEGDISDYTDIIKIFAAWSGFYWPWGDPDDPLLDKWAKDLGLSEALRDLVQGTGRVWGDFFQSGAYPVEPPCIPSSFWDNKSVMDGINQIKEILGFICYADATGGLVWRMPNIWRTGNYVSGAGFIGQDSVRAITDDKVLIDYGVQIDDESLRSEIHVVSAEDPTLHTSIQPGWSQGEVIPSAVDPQGDLALLGGQDRIMLVPNYPFISQAEVDKFAYLVSLWIHWSYRKGKVRVPGNPAWEPDDQVQIFERISEESYIHYIQGITSTMDMDAGTWYTDLDTHWLGAGPDKTWHVETYNDMPNALYAYLVAIGEIEEGGDPAKLPDDWDPNYEVPDFDPEYPRADDDYSHLFPDLPDIIYDGIDGTVSDEEIGDGVVSEPVNGSGGSVQWRGSAWREAYWGARGSDLLTTTFMYAHPAPTTYAAQFSHVNQSNNVRTTVPRASITAWRLVAKAFVLAAYDVKSCTAFAGVDRTIAGTSSYSAHAWGIAMDVNPYALGNSCCSESWSSWYSRPTSPDFYTAIKRIGRIRTNNGNRVFGWGGYWNTKKDYMHIEIVVTKADISDGVYQG